MGNVRRRFEYCIIRRRNPTEKAVKIDIERG